MKDPTDLITPEGLYHSRRDFLKAAGFVGASSLLLATCSGGQQKTATPPGADNESRPTSDPIITDELGDPLTPYSDVTGINNFYEFTLSKTDVGRLAADFPTAPWSIEVGGLVRNPGTISLEQLLSYEMEERIYRMRCVEGWSLVIPWSGFSLSNLLDDLQPKSEARYLRFETALDTDHMPGLSRYPYPWPYVEGLRLDEACHPLTILATGVYGESLPPQNGGPLRLVVPWKYGFKSIKSIVRIDLVADRPLTFWQGVAPAEYGFFANVNPEVDHPRWSQASELRLGESKRRPTLPFNGYAEDVASLYADMDLRQNF